MFCLATALSSAAPGMSSAAQAQAAAQARRRRRRPQRSASADCLDEPDSAPPKDWDERAYLAGRVPLISERDYTPLPPAPGDTKSFWTNTSHSGLHQPHCSKTLLLMCVPFETFHGECHFRSTEGIIRSTTRWIRSKESFRRQGLWRTSLSFWKNSHFQRQSTRTTTKRFDFFVPCSMTDVKSRIHEMKMCCLCSQITKQTSCPKDYSRHDCGFLNLSDTDFRWKPEWLGKDKERRRKLSHKAHQLGLDEHEVIYSVEKRGKSSVLKIFPSKPAIETHLLSQIGTKCFLSSDNHPDRDGDRPELTVPFDEDEFLQGKIPVLGGEAKPREPVGKWVLFGHSSTGARSRSLSLTCKGSEMKIFCQLTWPDFRYCGTFCKLAIHTLRSLSMDCLAHTWPNFAPFCLHAVKEEVKPEWQDSAQKKKQAFTDQYLDVLNQPKGAFEIPFTLNNSFLNVIVNWNFTTAGCICSKRKHLHNWTKMYFSCRVAHATVLVFSFLSKPPSMQIRESVTVKSQHSHPAWHDHPFFIVSVTYCMKTPTTILFEQRKRKLKWNGKTKLRGERRFWQRRFYRALPNQRVSLILFGFFPTCRFLTPCSVRMHVDQSCLSHVCHFLGDLHHAKTSSDLTNSSVNCRSWGSWVRVEGNRREEETKFDSEAAGDGPTERWAERTSKNPTFQLNTNHFHAKPDNRCISSTQVRQRHFFVIPNTPANPAVKWEFCNSAQASDTLFLSEHRQGWRSPWMGWSRREEAGGCQGTTRDSGQKHRWGKHQEWTCSKQLPLLWQVSFFTSSSFLLEQRQKRNHTSVGRNCGKKKEGCQEKAAKTRPTKR